MGDALGAAVEFEPPPGGFPEVAAIVAAAHNR